MGRSIFNSSRDIKIEQKLFLVSWGNRGNRVVLSERTRNASYSMDLDFESFFWVISKMGDYIYKPQSCPVFNRFRGQEAVVTMQKFVNGNGSYLEISKLIWKGKTQRIIIPSGRFQWGWKWMVNNLSKIKLYRGGIVSRYRDNRKLKEQVQQRRLVNFKGVEQGFPEEEVSKNIPECRNKDWNKALIITREDVNISWDLVIKTLGKAVQRRIEVYPFQANKAVWWPHNEEDASFYLRLKRCFLEKKVSLTFDKWTPNINSEDEVFECCNSWIRLMGIPWDLWSSALFNNIGDQCGGLLSISQDTILLKDLSAAKIKVLGIEGGFINRNLQIQTSGGPLDVRIIVDSVNLSAYEHLEKRSYAQVLVHGSRVMCGWGKRAGGQTDVSTTEDPKDVQNKQKQEITEQPVVPADNIIKNNQINEVTKSGRATSTEGIIFSEKGENSGGRSCMSEPWNRGKYIKILKKIRPKDEIEFHKGKIESTSKTEAIIKDKQVSEKEECHNERKFEHVYYRKHTKSNRDSNMLQSQQASKIPIIELDNDIIQGEDGNWQDQPLQGGMENISDEENDFSDADSHISDCSDKITRQPMELEDLGDLFEESPRKVRNLPDNSFPHKSTLRPNSMGFGESGGGVESKGDRGFLSLSQKVGISEIDLQGDMDGLLVTNSVGSKGKEDGHTSVKSDCLNLMEVERVEFHDAFDIGRRLLSQDVRFGQSEGEGQVN